MGINELASVGLQMFLLLCLLLKKERYSTHFYIGMIFIPTMFIVASDFQVQTPFYSYSTLVYNVKPQILRLYFYL